MKPRLTVSIIALTLQLLLSFSPFVPGLRKLWEGKEQFLIEIVILSVNFGLLSALLAFRGLLDQHDDEKFRKAVEARLSRFMLAQQMRAQDFYPQFRTAMGAATSHVYICYFAPYPPSARAHVDRKRYYAELPDFVRSHPDVQVFRLVRRTKENLPWVIEMSEALKGLPNAHLALLKDLPEKETMPLALSVQTIDGKKVWLVAVESHEPKGLYRDLYVEGEDLAQAMEVYYKRLWAHAVPILDAGAITSKGERIIAGGAIDE
jgi:hypothetical protein